MFKVVGGSRACRITFQNHWFYMFSQSCPWSCSDCVWCLIMSLFVLIGPIWENLQTKLFWKVLRHAPWTPTTFNTPSGHDREGLKQLFALLYTDGNDSSDDVVKRSEVFGEVNALYGWSAYFFFVQLVKKYSDYFRLSTTKNPSPKVARELARQQLKALLLRISFGKWLLSKLPKREFSILMT